jgi:hypothetical protein
LNQYPNIKFYDAFGKRDSLSAHLALKVQQRAHQLYDLVGKRPLNECLVDFYIVDRVIDLYSPLLHRDSFESALHDFIGVQNMSKIL